MVVTSKAGKSRMYQKVELWGETRYGHGHGCALKQDSDINGAVDIRPEHGGVHSFSWRLDFMCMACCIVGYYMPHALPLTIVDSLMTFSY
jgi:hypothetical protein